MGIDALKVSGVGAFGFIYTFCKPTNYEISYPWPHHSDDQDDDLCCSSKPNFELTIHRLTPI